MKIINTNKTGFKYYGLTGLLMGFLLLGLASTTHAQSGPGTSGLETGANGPDASGVPIDGGLSLLLAAGAGYGVKKIRQQRKKKSV